MKQASHYTSHSENQRKDRKEQKKMEKDGTDHNCSTVTASFESSCLALPGIVSQFDNLII